MDEKNIVLASSSPRRIEMMKSRGFDPIIMPAQVDETLPAVMDKRTATMYLALKKALAVEEMLDDTGGAPVIIAADTIVYDNGIIGKPENEKVAFDTLSALRNGMHFVVTGVAIIKAGTFERKVFSEMTKVFFKDYTDQFLREYVKTQEPYDKAGGYAIQGTFGQYVDHIEGDLDNVIGFPWEKICFYLKNF